MPFFVEFHSAADHLTNAIHCEPTIVADCVCVCVCIDPHIRFVWFCSNHVAIDFVRIHSLISNGLQFTHLACLQCLFAKCAKYWTWMRLFFAIELSGLDVCTWERVRTRQSSRAERITFSFLCKYSKSLLFVNYLSI